MRTSVLILLCCAAAAGQTTVPKGQILRPSGDATLTNIAVGSAVTTGGTFGYTAEVYLVKGDGSAAPRRLTSFDESNQAPGATSVAVSPDGTRAAYTGWLDTNGARQEQVHAIDVATGNDRLIATAQFTCATPPCLGPITFSQDGTKLLWGVAGPAATPVGSIYAANFDGSGLLQLGLQQAYISGPNNVTTAAGRFIFQSDDCGAFCDQAETANLDGSGATVIQTASNTVNGNFGDLVISASGAVTAEIAQGFTPSHVTPTVGPALSQGQCRQGQVYYGSMGSMTLSSDGTQAAGISAGQIFNCEGDIKPLNELYALDVQLSSAGSRMIFSVGFNSVGRAAVWIADASGANSRPIFAPRSLNAGGIVGIGSYASDILPLSPGSYFTIYGNNFVDVDALATPAELPFPQSLAGAKVQVNGSGVPVQTVTPWQINALLPQETAAGNVTVSVQLSDGTTLSQTATVQPTAPAVDLYPISGLLDLQAAAFHPGTNLPADSLHPAVAGEILETYGFGLGVTSPQVAAGTGAPSNPPANAAMPFVNIDGVLAQTTFAGLVPGFAGLYQVNVVVPAGLPPGKHLTHWYSLDPAAGPQGTIYTQ
jgi:uncharacterized protein (TIGR03437 family)